jgi:hypothetical protein
METLLACLLLVWCSSIPRRNDIAYRLPFIDIADYLCPATDSGALHERQQEKASIFMP